MSDKIAGKRIAILAADGFEESELFEPKKAIEEAGGKAVIVSLERGEIEANRHREKGRSIAVDETVDEARADTFDGLVLPGGVFSPDRLRTEGKVQGLVRDFFKLRKPVAAICHGPQILISADAVRGRTMTAIEAVRIDLANAGADVVDREVVVDEGLVTSRSPADLKAFCSKLVEEVAEGRHAAQAESV